MPVYYVVKTEIVQVKSDKTSRQTSFISIYIVLEQKTANVKVNNV